MNIYTKEDLIKKLKEIVNSGWIQNRKYFYPISDGNINRRAKNIPKMRKVLGKPSMGNRQAIEVLKLR
jgi:hypothetical protein